MLSRVASSLFWLSRYIERSDGMLRMLKIHYASSQDALNDFSWLPVINMYSNVPSQQLVDVEFNGRAVLKHMVLDKDNASSVFSVITKARENARSVQDYIAKDLWQCLNECYLLFKDPHLSRSLQKGDPVSVLDLLIKQIMLYYGTAEVTMERGEGRSFMNIGKYLERSIQSADILHLKFASLGENPNLLTDAYYWKHLLSSLGGYELYLKTYRQGFEAENILEQVILNTDFPRSVIYSINNIYRYFEKLKNGNHISNYSDLMFAIGRLQSRIRYSSVETISGDSLTFLTSLKNELYQIGESLNQKYFAYY